MQFQSLLKTNYLESFNSMMEKTTALKSKKPNKSVSFFDQPQTTLPNFE